MEEQQVTVDGESWPLPRPHLVIATQNPLSQRGTYPLVESQLDRFALATTMGYPSADDETQLVTHQAGKYALQDLEPVCSITEWLDAQRATESVPITAPVATYAVDLCRATRTAPGVRLGASPRAAIWLIRCAQAHALLAGRTYVLPDDVKAMAVACLAHRLVTDEGEHGTTGNRRIVEEVLEATPSPRP
jgi:MoxR-like ATPase